MRADVAQLSAIEAARKAGGICTVAADQIAHAIDAMQPFADVDFVRQALRDLAAARRHLVEAQGAVDMIAGRIR